VESRQEARVLPVRLANKVVKRKTVDNMFEKRERVDIRILLFCRIMKFMRTAYSGQKYYRLYLIPMTMIDGIKPRQATSISSQMDSNITRVWIIEM
jgi:hypothetical protein